MIEGYQCSPQQARLLSLMRRDHVMAPAGRFAISLHGALDEARLREALDATIARHEIFRTRFERVPGLALPLQVVGDTGIDWRATEDIGMRELTELLDDERDAPDPFGTEPLVSAQLIRKAPEEHWLLLSVSTLHVDRVTQHKLIAELADRYASGRAAIEEEDGVHYIDTSEWVNELLGSEEAEAGKAYWEELDLAGVLQISLPLEKRQVEPRYRQRATGPLELTPALAERLRALADRLETSPAALCCSALAMLVFRASETSRFAIGTVFSGRSDDDLERVMGPLARALPLVFEIDEGHRIADVVTAFMDTYAEAYEWQECFTWESLRLPDEESDFSVGFEEFRRQSPRGAGGVSFAPAGSRLLADRFDVCVQCVHDADELAIRLVWDTNMVADAAVARLGEMYLNLLDHLTASPETPVGALRLISAADHDFLLLQGEPVEVETPCFTRLFEARVDTDPRAEALIWEGQSWTYDALNRAANRVARHLRDAGVGPEVITGIFAERSPELVIGLLAVLKIGGTYLPLDPEYPEDRVRYMLEDSGAELILTREGLAHLLPDGARHLLIEDFADGEDGNLDFTPDPSGAAYVIYTSGSTGKPKGTIVSHDAIAAHGLGAAKHYGLSGADRMLQFASFNFDASLDQLVAPLLSGAAVVLRPEQVWSPAEVDRHIASLGLTVVNFPTAYWHLLAGEWADNHDPVDNPQLRLVIAGGEAMLPEPVRAWFRCAYRDVRLINAYGPTETTVTATAADIDLARSREDRMPIGRPLPGRSAVVLDGDLRWSAPGMAGHLYLGGIGVARGYLGRPGLTASVFLPDPYGGVPGARMYATGDRVRLLSDDSLQYLGREDEQVKIRGYRIEMGEIESALIGHHAVAEGVVAPITRGSGTDLIAWFVPVRNINPDEVAIRNYLARRLPEYMVPSAVVRMAALPLMPSGKVDRSALPVPELDRGPILEERTPTEAGVVTACAELLGIEHISKNDNFFTLGGHSLSAMQLVSRLRKTFEVELSLRDIFQAGDLADLARMVDEGLESGRVAVPRVTRVERDRPLPVSFAQQRMWLMNRADPASTDFHVTASVRITGPLRTDALERALDRIISRHETLRTTFHLEGEEPVQMIHDHVPRRLVIHDLGEPAEAHALAEAEAKRMAEAFARKPFDLATGPLVRFELLRIGPDDHLLLSAMHHIVSDGWSVGIMTRELAAGYEAFAAGRQPEMPELGLQYADFATWQRQWLQGTTLDHEMGYWHKQLADAPVTIALPAARQRPDQPTHIAGRHFFALDADRTKAINDLASKHGVTPFMVLLAALEATIHAHTEETDIVIGSDVANRNRGEMEGVIGFFVNQLVLRDDLSGDPTMGELLSRVRDTTLEAYAHQDMPFDKLVEVLNPKRDKDIHPLFQVKLVLQNTPSSVLKLGDLTLHTNPALSDRTLLDFHLEVWEGEESGCYEGLLTFNTDLYEEQTAIDVLDWFVETLKRAAERPSLRLSDLIAACRANRQALEAQRRESARDDRQDAFDSIFD